MKKKIVYIILILLVILISVIGFKKINGEKSEKIKINDNGLTIREENIVISTKQELEEYSNSKRRQFSEKYNEEFFKEKSLAIIYVETTNSADLVRIVEIEENGKQADIKFEHYTRQGDVIGLTVMGETLFVAEISKDIEVINIFEVEEK